MVQIPLKPKSNTINKSTIGTMVVEGQFKGVVIATAQQTVTGRLVSQMSHTKPAKAVCHSFYYIFVNIR